MKIEMLDKNNIKEYIKDLKLDDTDNIAKNVGNLNEFAVRKDDKFIFSFFVSDNCICIGFGNTKIDEDLVKEAILFLNNNLSFEGHLLIQVVDSRLMKIMDKLYRIKDISVTKKVDNVIDTSVMKEKYANIDMRSIKYYFSKSNIFCNLYSQNIQDEDVIKKLDEFFMECNTSTIDFCILPDSYEYMKSLEYDCISKRYVIDNN